MPQETRRGIVLHHQNPFMPSVRIKSHKVTNKRGDMMLVSGITGETQASIAGFWESKEVDSTKFIKLFVSGVKALAELSNAGTKVFELLYLEMEKNVGKDQVYLSFSGMDKNDKDLSERTFRRGLSELIEKKFIAGMPAVGWYWVNPDFIWNGDRIAFVQQYYRKNTQEIFNGQQLNSPINE